MLDSAGGRTRAKVQSVHPLAGHTVRIEWSDGVTDLLDLSPLLFNHRSYVALRDDRKLFSTVFVAVDRTAIEWSNGLRISTSALRKLPRTGMDAHELRAIMDDLRISVEGLSALLGLSRRTIADYRAGAPIPKPLALAMRYLEERGGI